MGDKVPSEPGARTAALPEGAVARGTVTAPPSKSHAIRALICAAVTGVMDDGPHACWLRYGAAALPEDVTATLAALTDLGSDVRYEPGAVGIAPSSSILVPRRGVTVDVGGSGTALRFISAFAAALVTSSSGPVTVSGNAQLLRRPAGAIVPSLRALGVRVDAGSGADGVLRPPLRISCGSKWGVRVAVRASESSQSISALLLVAPALPGGIDVVVEGPVASMPYVRLTVETMRQFGADVIESPTGWMVPPIGYGPPREHTIEGDWSSAAFLLGAAAATGGDVTVRGLVADSVQADRRIVEILRAFGATVDVAPDAVHASGRVSRPLDLDLRDAPDLAPLVGALACLVQGTSRVRGAAHLRIKETDRIAEVVRCARAWGCDARELPDGFEIDGGHPRGATIDPAGDHRLAMAFAVAGLAVPGTRIAEPSCVAKSYPAFWQDLDMLTGA